MKSESLGVSLTRLILVITILVSFGAIFGAAGYLVNNKQIMISQPQVLSTPEPTVTAAPIIKDETADWKTYRNEKYGFEIKYPNDSEGGNRGFVNETTLINFTINQGKDGAIGFILANNTIEEGVFNDNYFGEMSNPEIIIVDGKKAYKYQINKYCKGYVIAIPIQTNKTLEISLDDCYEGGAGVDFPDDQVNILDQILSTFKFIDKDTEPIADPDIQIETNENLTKFIVTYQNKKVGEITTQDPSNVNIFRQTENNIYLGVTPDGLGGYILYGGPFDLYKLNLKTENISEIAKGESGFFTDISSDESHVAIMENGITILDISNNQRKEFSIPEKYRVFGDVLFSPDGKKVAYAAANGEPDNEAGAVLIVDLASGKQTILASQTGEAYQINKWIDNNTVDYK